MDQLTVVHLSDLHISDAVDFQLLEALPTSMRIVREVTNSDFGDPLYYVVSGDLTENGSERQFQLAHQYLLARCQIEINGELTTPVGFDIGDMTRLAYVPGNHDNWGGSQGSITAPGFNKLITDRFFPRMPWRRLWTSKGGEIEFELFGMDSNAGLQETPELLQGGAFANAHVGQLRELLGERSARYNHARRARSVMFHHGLAFDTELVLSTNWIQESTEFVRAVVHSTTSGIIEAFDPRSERRLMHVRPAKAYPLYYQSRAELVAACGAAQVKTFLTGHNHCFARRPVPLETATGGVILEFQASTALKLPPPRHSRGFFVHQLRSDSAGLMWNTWAFKWTGSQFRPSHNAPDYIEKME